MNKHGVVLEGDCLERLRDVDARSVDVVLIDPPYNIGKDEWDDFGRTKKGYRPKPYSGASYYEWMEDVFRELNRVLKDSGSFWFFHNDFRAAAELDRRMQGATDLELRNFITWNKLFPGSSQEGYLKGYVQVAGLRSFQKICEYILFYTRKDLHMKLRQLRLERGVKSTDISAMIPSRNGNLTGWYSNIETGKNLPTEETIKPITHFLGITMDDIAPKFRNQGTHHSVWNYEFDEEKQGHLTPKPVELLCNIIRHCSDPGDLVLDCFAGSGSTGLACLETDRRYLLIEKEPEYVALANKRIAKWLSDREQQLW